MYNKCNYIVHAVAVYQWHCALDPIILQEEPKHSEKLSGERHGLQLSCPCTLQQPFCYECCRNTGCPHTTFISSIVVVCNNLISIKKQKRRRIEMATQINETSHVQVPMHHHTYTSTEAMTTAYHYNQRHIHRNATGLYM